MPEINANKLPEWNGALPPGGAEADSIFAATLFSRPESCFDRIMDIFHKIQRRKRLIDVHKPAFFSRMHNLNVIFVTFDYNYRIWEIMG